MQCHANAPILGFHSKEGSGKCMELRERSGNGIGNGDGNDAVGGRVAQGGQKRKMKHSNGGGKVEVCLGGKLELMGGLLKF